MIKINFIISDLSGGGAERVLVNLANHLSPEKYDITITTLFSKGINEHFLAKHIKHKSIFPFKAFRGYTVLQKIFTPTMLYKIVVKRSYDIEIAFMHHTPTRIVSGSTNINARKYAWVHTTGLKHSIYRSKKEFLRCYQNFDKIAFVSKNSLDWFVYNYGLTEKCHVVHNVNDSDKIISMSKDFVDIPNNVINLCSSGRLTSAIKGYDRLFNALGKLKREGFNNWHFYLLGEGPLRKKFERQIAEEQIYDNVTLLGFITNPYKYISQMDVFVCSSREEGYSTAVTEALIVGTPVLTTLCSGMDEIKGNSEAVQIVENSTEGLYNGLKSLFIHPDDIINLKKAAERRGGDFLLDKSIKEFEEFILDE